MRKLMNLVALAIGFGSLLIAGEGRACSCIPAGGRFLVWGRAVFPANAVGVPWWGALDWKDGDYTPPDSTLFRVEQWTHSTWTPVRFELVPIQNELTDAYQRSPNPQPFFLICPARGFRPNARYRFRYSGPGLLSRQDTLTVWDKSRNEVIVDIATRTCEAKSRAASVIILDHSFGEVTTSTVGGSCGVTIGGDRETIAIDLPEAWKSWAADLLYAVKVRGVGIWRPDLSLCDPTPPGTSSVGLGQEMLFSACDQRWGSPESALAPGKYLVEFTAWLPGTAEKVVGSTEVELACTSR